MNYKEYFKQKLLEQMGYVNPNKPNTTPNNSPSINKPIPKIVKPQSPGEILSGTYTGASGIHPKSPLGKEILSGKPLGAPRRRP